MASQLTQAQPQTQSQQQPPDCLLHIVLDVKHARATHDFLKEIFPVPASEGRIFLHPVGDHNDDNDEGNEDNDRDTIFVFPCVAVRFTSSNSCSCCAPGPETTGHGVQLAVLVDNVQLVRARLAQRGVECRDVPVGADGLEWLEFSDPDGYCWRVGRLVWEARQGGPDGAPGVGG